VLDVILQGAREDRSGIIQLHYTSISTEVLRDVVQKAIDRCTE
jgi:hypothetical protein